VRKRKAVAFLLAPGVAMLLASAVATPVAIEPDRVVLEDFEDDDVDDLPGGWKWRGFGQTENKPYRVEEEEGNRFLRAEDRGENVMLYKELRWNVEEYPYLSWRWRIRTAPDGGDERFEEKADSAAGVYLMYRRKLGIVPETVKFVWSSLLRRGDALRRPGIGMSWTVVAGAGRPDDSWRQVVYDVREVYRETFGGEPGSRPLGFGLLSDSNNTGGLAAADYDDFVALRSAAGLEVSGVERIVPIPR
jgi:hypothetical protein